MTLIDQRILIAAAAETVWQYLTRSEYVTRWNLGCKQLSVLTTRTQGIGVRRRCTDGRGKSTVEEITAWIENIGYEYKVVDGPYRTFRGRFRLQPAPEGTIVNWVVEYRRRGVFSGLRELLGRRRRMVRMMEESLRNLRKLVERSGAQLDPVRAARVAMQPAPDVAARAARGAEAVRAQAARRAANTPIVIGEDDLPESAAPTVIHQPIAEPSFVTKLSAVEHPPVSADSVADTKPRKPKGLAEVLQAKSGTPSTRSDEPIWDSSARTVPVSLVAPPLPPAEPTQALESTPPKPLPPRTLPEVPPTPAEGTPLPKLPTSAQPKPTTLYDTGEVSIWEVFGIPRPSEKTRTDLHQIVASLVPSAEPSSKPLSIPEPAVLPADPLYSAASRRHSLLRRKRQVCVRPLFEKSSAGRARFAQRSRLRVRSLALH
ncbi:MAG: SRPBCC family protein [Anaerolineae bacterium]|nr:SRPBCC family protein [Anaerolineae bacterium]